MRKIIQIGVAALLFLYGATFAHAADFQADYDINYAVSPTGNTIVTQNVTLTNKQSNLYPKQYSIILDTKNLKNIIAYDKKGVITPKIIAQGDKTEIQLVFNDHVVGLGKSMTFSLRYESTDIAEHLGNIWEIHIPGIEDDPSIGAYTVTLQRPDSFGPNAYMLPPPARGMTWERYQLLTGGVTAAFGEYQSFKAEISYPIENSRITSGIYEITIPPDTAFQKVVIKSIEPKPKNIIKDEDGNWIAKYELTAGQKLEVKTALDIFVYINPRKEWKQEQMNVNAYTLKQPFWEIDNELIKSTAKSLTTPKAIYSYVEKTLSYDYARAAIGPDRKGAVQALQSPKTSVCTEFTDAFVALARAANIPSRAAIGYAYTTNPKLRPTLTTADILHAWPEYYDATKNLWIPIDPTWANTTKGINYFDKLDFNHIVFAYHGISSELPYPAGSYKAGDTPKKTIAISFAEQKIQTTKEKYAATFDISTKVTAGTETGGFVVIENASATPVEVMTVEIQVLPNGTKKTETQKNIPPYGKISIPIVISIPGYLEKGVGKINVSVNGQTFSQTYEIQPMYWIFVPIFCIIASLLLLVWILLKKR